MVRFTMYNVATLLSHLYYKDEDGNHYPLYKDSAPMEDVLDEKSQAFFKRIYRCLDSTPIKVNNK